MITVGQLAVRVRVLGPEDSVGKAAEAVRSSTVGSVPVVRDGLLLGLITATALTEFFTRGGSADPGLTVAHLPLAPAVALPSTLSPMDALRFFHANGLERAPVLDGSGEILGIITQAELVPAVCGRVRPAVIGGMATPFGVYLAGGGVRGGVGDFALITTGMYIAVLQLLAAWLTTSILAGSWRLSAPQVWAALEQVPMLASALPFILFGLLFRVSWVTGYHAAEHQVVHAIEAGDDLRPEVIARKPRVHPRCGTNLVAAVMIMSTFWYHRYAELDSVWPLLAMLTTALFWRRFGGFLQQYVTTAPASPRQLESGILAGRQLMERYQMRPNMPRSAWRRIWDMGLLQVVLGSMIVIGAIYVLKHLGVPIPVEV